MHYFYISPEDYAEAEKNGISRARVYYRRYNEGWSLQRAITEPVRGYKDSGWNQWCDIATRNGVTYGLFMDRKAKGKSAEEAACTPPLKKREVITLMTQARRGKGAAANG